MSRKSLPDEYQELIQNASKVTLFQRSPADGMPLPDSSYVGRPSIERHVELSKTETQTMLEAINRGLAENRGFDRCFNPRHFLRAKRGGHILDLSFCFTCHLIKASLHGKTRKFATSRYAESLFDLYFPAYKAAREMSALVNDLARQIDAYQLPISPLLARDYAQIEKCEQLIRGHDDLENSLTLLARLSVLRKRLCERESKEVPR